MSCRRGSGSRLVCCASTCSTACSSFGGRPAELIAAPRLANSGAWLSCSVAAVCAAMVTATFSCGVRSGFGRRRSPVGRAALRPTPSATTSPHRRRHRPARHSSGGYHFRSSTLPASAPGPPAAEFRCARPSRARHIAIRTRSACSTFSTVASTTLPGCSRSSGAIAPASCAGNTGRIGLMVMAINEVLARPANLAQPRKPLVNRLPPISLSGP